MGFGETLAGIFKDAINLKGAKFFSGNSIYINVGGEHNRTKNSANIDLSKLTVQQKLELQGELRAQLNAGVPVLEESFKKEGDDYALYRDVSEYTNDVEYFKDIIPSEDYKILKAAYFLKYQYDTGLETRRIKDEIRKKYGTRGNNISNLCTAGYFATYIKPLYEAMSASVDFKPDHFLIAYNDIIQNYPFALFVSAGMGNSKVKQLIVKKILQCNKYGIKALNVHGIGSENIKNIRKTLDELEQDNKVQYTKTISEGGNFIVVKLSAMKIDRNAVADLIGA